MITESDVAKAFAYLNENGFPAERASRKWDIVDPATGSFWPPKVVLQLAHELAGEAPPPLGGGWPTNDPLKAMGFDIQLKIHLETATSVKEVEDIEDILNSPGRTETEKKRLVNARMGQGGFRQALEEIWQSTCALTGCTVREALRASHIKPWRESTDKERLDPENGFLLVANADALFDRGLISFSKDGALLSRKDIDLQSLGLGGASKIAISGGNEAYLAFHRDKLFKQS